MYDGGKLHKHIFLQRIHLGPVGYVGTESQLLVGLRFAEAVVNPLFVNRSVKVVSVFFFAIIYFACGGKDSAVAGCRRYAARVHKRNRADLVLVGLAALSVGEVSSRVPY